MSKKIYKLSVVGPMSFTAAKDMAEMIEAIAARGADVVMESAGEDGSTGQRATLPDGTKFKVPAGSPYGLNALHLQVLKNVAESGSPLTAEQRAAAAIAHIIEAGSETGINSQDLIPKVGLTGSTLGRSITTMRRMAGSKAKFAQYINTEKRNVGEKRENGSFRKLTFYTPTERAMEFFTNLRPIYRRALGLT